MLRYKLSIYITTIVFSIVAIFGCWLIMSNSMVMENIAGSSICCDLGLEDLGTHYNHQVHFIVGGNKILQILGSFFTILFVSALVYESIGYYHLSIRGKYGSFRFFDKFVFLFKRGLIHPKIF